jgi:type IV secretory pathway TrbD component
MSPEATALFLLAALVAAIVAAVLAQPWRNALFFLALWAVLYTVPPLVTAFKAT